MPFIQFEPFTTTFEAESTIYQKEVRCQVSENDFNYTLNPSAIRSGTSGSYIDAVTDQSLDLTQLLWVYITMQTNY